jgi:hypothetical protein
LLTGAQLEEIYNLGLKASLPYAECRRLASEQQQSEDDLISALEIYFSTIAGLSGSASHLASQSASVLRKARETLTLDFFETYPALKRYNSAITKHHTPKLYDQMSVAEQLRRGLLDLIDSLNVE